MKTIMINGVFAGFPVTGVARVSYCILAELDDICDDLKIELVIPEHVQNLTAAIVFQVILPFVQDYKD